MNPLIWLATPTPTPYPAYTGNENLVTPGVFGFALTAFVAIATVLLLVDMTRRMRRVRYRSEVREQLEAERLDGEPHES
jgi:HAMP domain-containing protein